MEIDDPDVQFLMSLFPNASMAVAEAEIIGISAPGDWDDMPEVDKAVWIVNSRASAIGRLMQVQEELRQLRDRLSAAALNHQSLAAEPRIANETHLGYEFSGDFRFDEPDDPEEEYPPRWSGDDATKVVASLYEAAEEFQSIADDGGAPAAPASQPERSPDTEPSPSSEVQQDDVSPSWSRHVKDVRQVTDSAAAEEVTEGATESERARDLFDVVSEVGEQLAREGTPASLEAFEHGGDERDPRVAVVPDAIAKLACREAGLEPERDDDGFDLVIEVGSLEPEQAPEAVANAIAVFAGMKSPEESLLHLATHAVSADGVQVGMSTVDRAPNYIHETLGSMYSSEPLAEVVETRLVVCGTDGSYLDLARDEIERWWPAARHAIETVSDETWLADFDKRSRKHRTVLNFLRILQGADPRRGLVALQDDLRFARRWLERTLDVARLIEKKHERYVLSLYASYKFKGKPYYGYNAVKFYGNQALYLPPSVHPLLREAIEHNLAAGRWEPDDMAVKSFLMATKIPLFCCNPNLVQHIGQESAIEQRFHASPSFQP